MFKDKLQKKALAAYNGEHVLERVLKHGEDALNLGGQVKNMTISFQEIVGFTDVSERLSPEGLVHLLNEYLTVMTDLVESHKGTVDRYIGDTILAFWGANDETGHADKACACTLDAIEQGKLLSEHWSPQGIPPLSVIIGINSGRVILGNIGTSSRFQYTVLGDNVNLTSHLEGANLQYGTDILFSEFTKDQLHKLSNVAGG